MKTMTTTMITMMRTMMLFVVDDNVTGNDSDDDGSVSDGNIYNASWLVILEVPHVKSRKL